MMIPFALFNSKAIFNPYQYRPFMKVFKKNENENGYELNGKNLFITDEVGVGKTFEVGIILQEILKNNNNSSVVIVCPTTLCNNWKEEMRENFYLDFNNYKENKQWGQFNIIPYSYFGNGPQISTPIKYDVLICDEAHCFRNKGKRFEGIEALIEGKLEDKALKIFMTATPVFNDKTDYTNITSLLKGKEQSFETTNTLQVEAYQDVEKLEIRSIIVRFDKNENEIIKKINSGEYGNITGFLKRIAASSINSLKKFIEGSMNESVDYKEYLEFEDLQSEKLEEEALKKEYLEFEDLQSEKLEEKALKEMLVLWKKNTKDTKLENLKNLLKEVLEEEEEEGKTNFKAIVFSCFIDTCKYLKESLGEDYKIFMITGNSNSREFESAKDEFKSCEDNAVLICSDVAKEGHNFQFCHYLIHYDFPYTPAAISQRNGRIYRKGQLDTPKVYYMIVKGSYDDRLFGEIIMYKANLVKELASKNLISELNIFPKDTNEDKLELYKECLGEYFKEEEIKIKNKYNKENTNDINNVEKISELKEGYYKNLCDSLGLEKLELGKLEQSNTIIEGYKNIIVKSIIDNKSADNSTNESSNKEEFGKIIKTFFGDNGDSKEETTLEELEELFEKKCDEYLKHELRKRENEFCHEYKEDSEYSEYSKQFKPLVILKEGENNE